MSEIYSNFADQPGLQIALDAAGIGCWWQGGELWVSDLTAAQAIVASYNALPAIQAASVATVEAKLASKIAAGLVIGSSTVAIDPTTQSEINQLCNLAHVTIAGLTSVVWPTTPTRYWPVLSGSPIALATPQDALAIGVPAAHYVWSLKNYADTLAAQIMAATTSAAVAAVITNANWPTS
jgi:hypothetical protein